MKKLFLPCFIFFFSLINLSIADWSFEKETNPENLPYCSNDIAPSKWNDCYAHVEYENGFEYSGVWKYGQYSGKGIIFDNSKNFEFGIFDYGMFSWQSNYDYSYLNGKWEPKRAEYGSTIPFSEVIYMYDGWVGFENIDKVCRVLATNRGFVRNVKSKMYGVNDLSVVVLMTNCKDNKFSLSFDNIFISNKGDLVLMQMKVIGINEGDNPIFNATFPEKYYPGLDATYVDSFEREDVLFYKIQKIQDTMTEEQFMEVFGHKFEKE